MFLSWSTIQEAYPGVWRPVRQVELNSTFLGFGFYASNSFRGQAGIVAVPHWVLLALIGILAVPYFRPRKAGNAPGFPVVENKSS